MEMESEERCEYLGSEVTATSEFFHASVCNTKLSASLSLMLKITSDTGDMSEEVKKEKESSEKNIL